MGRYSTKAEEIKSPIHFFSSHLMSSHLVSSYLTLEIVAQVLKIHVVSGSINKTIFVSFKCSHPYNRF
jgi:hypothetical protein